MAMARLYKKCGCLSWMLCSKEKPTTSPSSSSSSLPMEAMKVPGGTGGGDGGEIVGPAKACRKKPGGWRTMPFILGNETFERLASFSLLANFMVYLKQKYHMDQVSASNLINIWSGISNIAPMLGAFLSDAIFGRYRVIAFSSFASFFGMVVFTLTAWIPSLSPKQCPSPAQCDLVGPNMTQMGVLVLGLGFLTVGTAGIRPNSIPFGVDQFDFTSEEGRRGINSYYNWYYTTFTVVVMLALTVMVYVQDNFSWVVGFGIPTILMLASIVLFFLGARRYVCVEPEGSIFSGIAQTFVAAFRKRRLLLPREEEGVVDYYDPPLESITVSKLPLTNEFRFLNKGAIIEKGDLNEEGRHSSKWKLSSVQQIEEVKCLIRVLPVWASGILCFTAAAQQYTYTVSQALTMDRHVTKTSSFQVPAGSLSVISMLAVGIWVPIYDRLVVSALRKVTRHEEGITLLQRMGIGLVLSVASMVVAGVVEKHRREWALANHKPLSVFWLAPQLILMGLAEGFNFIAQIEFYNKQFPENMRSLATSLFFCTVAGANYVSSLLTSVVHDVTHKPGKRDWLSDNLDQGRLDYYYYLIAVLGGFDVVYFIVVSIRYRYKHAKFEEMIPLADLEQTSAKF